ncbi:pentapeptide repeat-containing protein, partial [candidate division KSB3 bacterium]|nr:pentapeptide repeat-containing protein [candidate division KSB3 bacterium]
MMELKNILENHKKWLDGTGGDRADLRDADLRDADLGGAVLYGANLYGA